MDAQPSRPRSAAYVPPCVSIMFVGSRGWEEARLSLRAWSIHGRAILASAECVVWCRVEGDLTP